MNDFNGTPESGGQINVCLPKFSQKNKMFTNINRAFGITDSVTELELVNTRNDAETLDEISNEKYRFSIEQSIVGKHTCTTRILAGE